MQGFFAINGPLIYAAAELSVVSTGTDYRLL